MTQEKTRPAELEDILTRLESGKAALIDALESASPKSFEATNEEGETLKRLIERTADDVNFYYGRLAARALNLPQPPCMQRAEFGSLREGLMSLQVAHRRFTNLLHDVVPDDLEKVAADPELGTYTLRQILELAAAQYARRATQVAKFAAAPSSRKRKA